MKTQQFVESLTFRCSVRVTSLIGVVLLVLFGSPNCEAIPAFARLYGTSCTTCHLDFPKLNDFGKAFKDAGFKFPKDDLSMLKVPPVMLGAEANKEAFPHSVWPGSIPGLPPIGLRMNTFFQYTGPNVARYNAFAPAGSAPPIIPTTDFATGFFSIFTAGNLGGDIAFWADDDISVSGDNSAGSLGDGYLKFVNIGRVMKLPTDSLTFRVGQFELDLPFTQARSINISPYDIYQESNVGAMNSLVTPQQNVNNQFVFANPARGIELSGGHQYGGYHYSVALVDQNTSGVSQSANTFAFVPTPTASAGGGIGYGSDSGLKTVYSRLSYRFNLERDKQNRNEIRAAGPTGPRDHTSLSVGSFYLTGKSQQALLGENASGSTTTLRAQEPYYRAGGDLSFNYRNLNVFGLYMFGHDVNLLPIDANGTPIPLPITSGGPVPVAFVRSVPSQFSGGFGQADYLVLPWIMLIMRADVVNSSADRINGLVQSTITPYFAPYRSTRTRFTPGIQFLIRPNVKASFEYQFRPQQVATVFVDPTTGTQTAVNPFRVNTAVGALEFVY